jgi:high affinity sulfate transporter 1
VFSTVNALHPANAATYASLAAGLVLITGLLFVVAGVCRLGFVTQFLSRPVMEGFVFGLAIFVSISQLPKLLGLEKGEGDSIRQLGHILANLGDSSLTTLAVGAVAIAALFALERYLPRLPGGLIVLAVSITLSAAFNLVDHGVATVGKIPTGLPSVGVPHLDTADLWALVPSAAGLVLVIFSEALGAGNAFADKHGYRLEPNQEMIALGAANVGSGLVGGLAAGGSLSQSAVNDGAGARTQVSTLVAAALALVTVVALTPLFTDLPEAVLAALIIHAVSHLMKFALMRRFYLLLPRDFWLGMITLLAVITLDVLPALIIGVTFSILLLVFRASRPRLSQLGRHPSAPDVFVDLARNPQAVAVEGLLIIRPDAPMFYANAQTIQDGVLALATQQDAVHTVLIDLDANDELDITSLEALSTLAIGLERREVRFALAHLHTPAAEIARREGLLEHITPDRIHPNLATAVAWATASTPR